MGDYQVNQLVSAAWAVAQMAAHIDELAGRELAGHQADQIRRMKVRTQVVIGHARLLAR